MQMVMHLLAPQTHKWRTTLYRTLRDMGVSEEAGPQQHLFSHIYAGTGLAGVHSSSWNVYAWLCLAAPVTTPCSCNSCHTMLVCHVFTAAAAAICQAALVEAAAAVKGQPGSMCLGLRSSWLRHHWLAASYPLLQGIAIHLTCGRQGCFASRACG
jgi:hypothetical protein